MRLGGFVEEERPGVAGRLRDRRLDDACAELLELRDVPLRRAVLRSGRPADRRRLRQQADRQPVQARLGHRRAGEHRPHERDVRDARRHRPDRVERGTEREHAVDRDATPGGLEPDDAAARRRQPNRAARVGAEAEVAEPGGERRGVAARRAAGRTPRMRRVVHRPVPRVLARHAPRELVQVRLADDDRTGRRRAAAPPRRFASARGRRRSSSRTSCGCPPCRSGPSRGAACRAADRAAPRRARPP